MRGVERGRSPSTPDRTRPKGGSTMRLSPFAGRETGALEREADRAAERALEVSRADGWGALFTPSAPAAPATPNTGIQHKCCGGGRECSCHKQESEHPEEDGLQRQVDGTAAAVGQPSAAAAPLIIEDDVAAQSGQIARSEFLAMARSTLCRAADDELAAVGRSSSNCPYIEYWWGRFAGYSAARVERAVALFARVRERSIGAYLAAIETTTRERVRQWIASGGMAVPEDIDAMSAMTTERPAQAKRADGGAAKAMTVPDAILSRLDTGRSLDGQARSRMQRGFGQSFDHVRVHTGATASAVARERGALALTIGSNILFREDAFRPGTLRGDALLAHELAHTIQQSGGGMMSAADPSHESEADHAAAAAVAAGHGHGSAAGELARTGVGVHACNPTRKRCPPGMMWGNVANQTGTVGAGSFGCACTYRCVTQTYTPQETSICPATGCARITYETVGENYVFRVDGQVQQVPVSSRASTDDTAHGWGASATPLTADHACLCGGVDIEGDPTGRSEAVSITPIAVDAVDAVGPAADVAAARRSRATQTDTTMGTRLPDRRPRDPVEDRPPRDEVVATGPRRSGPETVQGFRAQGRPLIALDDAGNVTVLRPAGRQRQGVAVHVGFDSQRARMWIQEMGRGEVIEFTVRAEFLDRLRETAQPEHGVVRDRTRPWRVDIDYPDQYAIPPALLDALQSAIVPGSGRRHTDPSTLDRP